jgi:ribosomal protein S18 acetylase RimI-like enzyme
MNMASLTKLLAPSTSQGNPRPIDLRRDLNPIADLMERCFADTLDPDGLRYLQHMRAAARHPGYASWRRIAADGAPLPVSGYVWEEAGALVGNLTLIPYYTLRTRYYLIANVAVHPDYRRRGIATHLTNAALEHARQRGAQSVWLHVRQENVGASLLYRRAGFEERARRSTWYLEPKVSSEAVAPGILPEAAHPRLRVQARPSADWRWQRPWLEGRYPETLNWHLSLKLNALQPGLWGFFYRFLNDLQVRQWSARRGSQLIGVLAWQAMPSYADSLWLAAPPHSEDIAASCLLEHLRRHPVKRKPVALDYPAGRAAQAIQDAGFHLHQTLIWMSLKL